MNFRKLAIWFISYVFAQKAKWMEQAWDTACDLTRQNAKAELLAEWRATDAHEWLDKQAQVRATGRDYAWWPREEIAEALAMARAQGTQPNGHTANCAVNHSGACNCR